ncbi:TniB family NTP-binding protein [Planomonospora algeriensis]
MVTGAAGTGKTTAIIQLGKQHEHQARRRRQGKAPFQPVVFVTIPPAATAKMVAAEFARFLGIPLPSRPNQIEITNMVCDVLCDLGTDLVIVDEIHNLNLGSRVGAETSDQLKYLSERIPATFLYAGIDVESAGLFTGTRGRQIAGRFATLTTSPFAYGTQAERNDWSSLIATMEDALRLYRHRPGSLVRLAPYLYQRTSGMIGSLSHLIREAAIEAILNGSEKLTKPLLEHVTLDHAAETSRPKTRRSRAGRRPGKVA